MGTRPETKDVTFCDSCGVAWNAMRPIAVCDACNGDFCLHHVAPVRHRCNGETNQR